MLRGYWRGWLGSGTLTFRRYIRFTYRNKRTLHSILFFNSFWIKIVLCIKLKYAKYIFKGRNKSPVYHRITIKLFRKAFKLKNWGSDKGFRRRALIFSHMIGRQRDWLRERLWEQHLTRNGISWMNKDRCERMFLHENRSCFMLRFVAPYKIHICYRALRFLHAY